MREQYINEAINEEIKKQLDLKIREDVSRKDINDRAYV